MTPIRPDSIDEYLSALPGDQAATLSELRNTILATAPGAEECFSYGLPALRLGGKVLAAFAARAGHLALYPMSGTVVESLGDELAGFDTGKGTIRFSVEHPLPASLVRRIVEVRMAELRENRPG